MIRAEASREKEAITSQLREAERARDQAKVGAAIKKQEAEAIRTEADVQAEKKRLEGIKGFAVSEEAKELVEMAEELQKQGYKVMLLLFLTVVFGVLALTQILYKLLDFYLGSRQKGPVWPQIVAVFRSFFPSPEASSYRPPPTGTAMAPPQAEPHHKLN